MAPLLLNCVPPQEGGPLQELPLQGPSPQESTLQPDLALVCEAAWCRFLYHHFPVRSSAAPPWPKLQLRKLFSYHPLFRPASLPSTAFAEQVLAPGLLDRPARLVPGASPFPLRPRRTRHRGWGIFSLGPIPARRKVIAYTGERINRQEATRRSARPRVEIICAGPNLYLDPAFGGSGAEFINHSCSPNLFVRRQAGHVLLFSRRLIAAGEELTFDYHRPPNEPSSPCACGSSNCRGFF